MDDFSPILAHIKSQILLNEEELAIFQSVLRIKKVKRRQLIEQPGFVSRYRNYIVKGAFRAYLLDMNGHEHTISLAVDDGWTGDPGSFLTQEPATLIVEALENGTLIQWTYESEQMLLKQIPEFPMVMLQKSQQIAVAIQRRLISRLSMTAEERYDEFARNNGALLARIPLYIIASYLGMTREFLSKIRNQRSS